MSYSTGLSAGADRPRWLRVLERHYGRELGGAWPEQNRVRMEREPRPQGATEIANHTEVEQKEARTGLGTGRAGTPALRVCGADAGKNGGRKRVGMPRGDRVDRNPVAHSPVGGVDRGEGAGGGQSSKTAEAE